MNQGKLSRRTLLETALAGSVGAIGAGVLAPLGGNQAAAGPATSPASDTAQSVSRTMLFLDDELLFTRLNVTRQLGKPKRVGDYHETAGNCTWGYPGVFRDTRTGLWRMVYQAGVGMRNVGGCIVLLAESEDGLTWKPRDTRADIQIRNRIAPHELLRGDVKIMSSCYEDLRAADSERYKLLSVSPSKLWTSPDLVHWTLQKNISWQDEAPDPPSFAYWNPIRSSYSITTRPDHSDRRICLVETRDWKTFTRPELVITADAEDVPLAQIYGLYVLPYDNYFLGMLWMYEAGGSDTNMAPHRYRGGVQETYLAYSTTGQHWQRCMHRPLFENGTGNDPDAGCLQVSSIVPLDERTLRCYASCSTRQHGDCPPEDGYIVAYEIRRDGFAYLENEAGKTGVVGTRALYWRGGEAKLNLDASAGRARIRVIEANGKPVAGFTYDDFVPITTDEIGVIPRWKNERTIASLAGRMLMIEVELESARLYAARGDFVPCRLHDVQKFEKNKSIPMCRPGF